MLQLNTTKTIIAFSPPFFTGLQILLNPIMVFFVKFYYLSGNRLLKQKKVNANQETPVRNTLKGRFSELSKALQAYLTAFNEVAIVSLTDLNGTIIYVNDKFVDISQYSREELIGKTHRIINSSYHPQEFFSNMWQTISDGKPWRAEIKNKAKDGSYYWVDTVITPVKDENEKPYQYLSIRNLITIQKEHEEKLVDYQKALLAKTRQLNDAQKVAKTGSWHLDTPGNLLEWSEETYRIFEIPFDIPMTYELFLEKVHPDDRFRVEKGWTDALKTGFYELEHRISTPSGEKWVSERASLELAPTAALNTALGTVQDITEKKKTENLLKESEALYRELFNASPFAIGLLDKETLQFLEVNETAVKLYGYSKEEFLQLSAYDIRLPEDHEKLKNLIKKRQFTTDKTIRQHRKKNGEIILIEPTITEVEYRNKKAFLISIYDVTEKHTMQEELAREKYNRQKEIDRATLEAEEKSRAAIGRELHDNINQLLVASTLFFKKTTAASDKDFSLLQKGIEIIGKAIEEIRKLSSHFVPPSLNNITLEESIEHLAQNIKLTGAKVKFEINLIEELLDEKFKVNLYRIIQEQFSNIIKYAAAATIYVKLNQSDTSLTLEITDDGRGFNVPQKATGIGLANIRHRANLYNGAAVIESSPGNGCRVMIEFILPQASA